MMLSVHGGTMVPVTPLHLHLTAVAATMPHPFDALLCNFVQLT